MKCLVCMSDELHWVETIMENDSEGYKAYNCVNCSSRIEFGISIVECQYTGKDDVFPYEVS